MIRRSSFSPAVLTLVLALPFLARAQTPTPIARGQAFGTRLDLGGTNAIDQSDTGVQTAPNAAKTPAPTPSPGCAKSTSTSADSFDVCAGGAQIPAAPLAEVVTGPSRTRGCSHISGCPDLFPPAAPALTPTPIGPLSATLQGKQFVFSEGGNSTA